ncbi:hypothetical protein Tco_0246018 [Tanacetum coccineum]
MDKNLSPIFGRLFAQMPQKQRGLKMLQVGKDALILSLIGEIIVTLHGQRKELCLDTRNSSDTLTIYCSKKILPFEFKDENGEKTVRIIKRELTCAHVIEAKIGNLIELMYMQVILPQLELS